jgi:serine protease
MFGKTQKMRLSLCAAAMAMLAPMAWAGGPATAFDAAVLNVAPANPAPTDRLIVKYRDMQGATSLSAGAMAADRLSTLQAQAARHGVQLKHLRNTALGAHVLKLDRRLSVKDATALAASLKAQDPAIEYAEPDRILHPLMMPNDPQYGSQWDLSESTGGIRAPQAWDLSNGSGIVVAVIDTGYRPHADVKANIIGGYDFINDTAVSNDGNGRDSDASDPGDWVAAGECGSGSPAEDSSWHGTHVAGTIAAVANNSTGVAGIAYGAKVLPARVLGKCGGYTSDIADAIVWTSGGTVSGVPANANPARVINMSLGGQGACDTTTQNAINSARSRNTVVVVAAGNSAQDASGFSPASCAGVISVAATDRYGARSYYSNFGSSVTLAAPGGDMRSSASNGILSTLNAGTTTPGADNYAYYQGTSMASPHVAAVVALMLSKKPSLTPDQVASMLKSTARAFPGSCSGCGAGILDAYAAVQAAIGGPIDGSNETEPNDSRTAANPVAAPTTLNGTMGSTTDTDWFSVDLPAGKTLSATLTPNSSSDYDLYVYNSVGTQIGASENGTGAVDSVSVTNTGSGTIKRYVRVVYYAGGTGSTSGKYTLKLSW